MRAVEQIMGTCEKTVTEAEWITRRKYHCSIVSRRAIKAGQQIAYDMLTVKNPGTGISASRLRDIVGMRAITDIAGDVLITEGMLTK